MSEIGNFGRDVREFLLGLLHEDTSHAPTRSRRAMAAARVLSWRSDIAGGDLEMISAG